MTNHISLKEEVWYFASQPIQNEVQRAEAFEQLALTIFRYQMKHNPVYRAYVKQLGKKVEDINRLTQIPCLPIQFFKTHQILSGDWITRDIFESSGTTGQQTSRHLVPDLEFYEMMSELTFEQYYGSLTEFHILALLPSYLERKTSSLVYMVKNFIHRTYSKSSGFYLNNQDELLEKLQYLLENDTSNRKILLIGVTFALLDLVESGKDLSFIQPHAHRLVVMETGGMKGRRREMIREEVHEVLKEKLGVSAIHSEYGMTELLSQAYAQSDGDFQCARTMRVLLREVNDPFTYLPSFKIGEQQGVAERGRTGGINVIDLVNIDSCCFIETQDLGAYSANYDTFKVLGRLDNAEQRGCNLMIG